MRFAQRYYDYKRTNPLSVVEAGLVEGDVQFPIHGSEYTLHLSKREHASEEGVPSIVAMGRLIHDASGLVGESHTMIHTHR